MGMKHKKDYNYKLVHHIYQQIPAFTDVFTEESFYMFFFSFVVCSIIIVFIISRFVTLKPSE